MSEERDDIDWSLTTWEDSRRAYDKPKPKEVRDHF